MLYPRALQQLFVGLYIAEICIIGLLAVSIKKGPAGAIGPFVLMIILLIITALYHIALNSAMSPLLHYLPKTLDAEERKGALIASGKAHADNGVESDSGKAELGKVSSVITAPKHPKPSILTKFLKPHIYSDYATQRRLMPTAVNTDEEEIDPTLARDAYLPPGVWNELPRLIVPRDPAGISGHEVLASGKVVPITDAGATLDDKNAIVLDEDKMAELYFKEKDQRMGYDV